MSSSHLNSFLRDSGRLYTIYLAVGLAAIPGGVVYAVLAVKGYGGWWSALLAIVFAFWMAKEAWRYVERAFFTLEFTASGVVVTWQVPATTVLVVLLWLPPMASLPRPVPITPRHPTEAGTVVTTGQPEQLTEQPIMTCEHGA